MELFGGGGHNLDMPKLQLAVPLLAFTVGSVGVSVAQDFSPASASKPSFEVASVKPNKGNSGGMSSAMQPGGRFVVTNLSLAIIIRQAFGVSQLVGLPDWASS